MGTLIPLKTQISTAHSEHLTSHFHSVGRTHFMNIDSKIDNNNSKPAFLWSEENWKGEGEVPLVFSPRMTSWVKQKNSWSNPFITKVVMLNFAWVTIWNYSYPPLKQKSIFFNSFKQVFIAYGWPLDWVESDFSLSINHYHQDGNNGTQHWGYCEAVSQSLQRDFMTYKVYHEKYPCWYGQHPQYHCPKTQHLHH